MDIGIFLFKQIIKKQGTPRITSMRQFNLANNSLDAATAGSVYIQSSCIILIIETKAILTKICRKNMNVK